MASELDNVLADIKSVSYADIEKVSQECSKNIVFSYLEGNAKSEYRTDDYITKCQKVLDEYKVRTVNEKYKGISLDDLKFTEAKTS